MHIEEGYRDGKKKVGSNIHFRDMTNCAVNEGTIATHDACHS